MHNSLSCLNLLVSFGTFCDSCVILQKQTKRDEFLEDHKAPMLSAMGTQFHGTLIRPCMRFGIPGFMSCMISWTKSSMHSIYLKGQRTAMEGAMAHLPNLQRNLKEIHDYIDLQWDICRELTYLFTSAKGSSHPYHFGREHVCSREMGWWLTINKYPRFCVSGPPNFRGMFPKKSL